MEQIDCCSEAEEDCVMLAIKHARGSSSELHVGNHGIARAFQWENLAIMESNHSKQKLTYSMSSWRRVDQWIKSRKVRDGGLNDLNVLGHSFIEAVETAKPFDPLAG